MTSGDVETQGQGDTREAFARVTSLLELPQEQRRANEGWEGDVRVAFRACLAQGAQPHVIATLLPRLPPAVALEELHRAWRDLPLKTREKIVIAFRQKAALLPLSVGLASQLLSNAAVSEASESAAAALQALKRPASSELRAWVDGGGLHDLTALILPLRDRLPDIADHLETLIAAAENAVQTSTKQTIRTRVTEFTRTATALLEAARLEQDRTAVLTNRLSGLAKRAEKLSPETNRKETRTAEKKAPDLHARRGSTPPTASQVSSTETVSSRSHSTKPDLTNPRTLIDALGQIVKLLEELETRREQAALSERVREEKQDLEHQLADVRESLANESRIVASLRTRVAELEEDAESLKRERDSGLRRCADLERGVANAESRLRELDRERARLLDELPEQRLAESRAKVRARIKPILDELDDFQSHPDLPHETLAFLDRYRSLKEILTQEKIADA